MEGLREGVMDNTENKEISIEEEKRAFTQKMFSELSQVLSGIHIKRDASEISNCFSEIRKAVMLGDVKGDISSYVLNKMKEMNLLDNSNDVKKLEENVANFGERNNEAYSKLKERSNKEGGDSFVDNLSYRVFMDKSFSDVQANAIYRASMEASYNQYKGQKDADLSYDFKQGLKKSGRFTDEEINKLGEMAKMSIEATKDVEKLPNNIEKLFNKKFENEKLEESLIKIASKDVNNISKPMENQFEPKLNGQNESNLLKDKNNNKVNENNFVSEVFDKAYLDRSFSDDKQYRIYNAAFDALYEQYKGGKQVNLTEVFMENIEKSGQFNDEEKKKLKEFSLKTEEDVKDAKNIPENLKESFDKKLKNEKEIKDLKNKTNSLKESNQIEGFDSVMFTKAYSDTSFSNEQRSGIYRASIDAMYALYKGGKQVNLTDAFMENIEKSGKFNDEEKKKLKGFSLEAVEEVKDVEKIPQRLLKVFEKTQKIEEVMNNAVSGSNALKGSEYNVNIEANKQDEELKNLIAERVKKDAEWKKRQEETNNVFEQKIQKVAQSRNDSNFLTSFMEEAVMLNPNPEQTSFIFNKLREVSEQTGNNSDKTSERADTLLKKSIKDSNVFSDFEKERLFETMDKLSNIYANDARKPSDIKIEAKKENVVNNEKVEPALRKEEVNIKKENTVKPNELHNGHINMENRTSNVNENRSINNPKPEFSSYIQMAQNKIAKENAPIGFASRILSDMDKHPHISRETKDMFLDMAIKTSKEVAAQGLNMGSIEGMEAFAEIIGKKMKDNKEFGENGLKDVKEIMEKGVYFNQLPNAWNLTDKVLNAGIDDKPSENKKEEVKVENKPKETVNEAKSVNTKDEVVKENNGAKPLDAEFELKLKRVENSEAYKDLVISANLNEEQQEAVKKAMALKLPSESKENAQNKVAIEEKPKENAPKEKVSNGKSVEETLVDEVIKKGNLSKETGDEILNIASQMEQSRLKGESLNGKTYSEVFIDKVIASKEISEKDKNKLLDMAIKTESKEIASKEKGNRLYFDESKMARFDQLNLSDDMKKALDFEVKDGKFSIKIPEDDKLKKDVINRIKVQEGKEKIELMNKGEMPKAQKPVMKDLSSNLTQFMAQNNSR